ncbi:purple acid phosphatase 15 [Quercus suber]|uniref:Purple acid phosphatase n=1 Tax=Quercus suber TaxID=58331 RepID=A0AAW0K6L1_QUESU
MGFAPMSVIELVLVLSLSFFHGGEGVLSTLDGPFKPVTVPLDNSSRGKAVDLSDTDPVVQRVVEGFEPEQISLSLSATYDSVWISWITGEFHIGYNITSLDPKTVASVVQYGMYGLPITDEATEDQYKWLERDLASVDREVTPWLVAAWHPPWYSTYMAHYREAECMRVEMEDILYKYGVDIVFNGHVHAYERSNRVYNYTLDPCGPIHIVVGDGGNREKMAIAHADEAGNCPEPSTTPDEYMGGFCAFNFTSGPAEGKFCWDRQPDYSAYRESSFGHGILEVQNETHALWTWHRNKDMYNLAGDEIYIVRQPDRCPVESGGT